MNVQPATGDTMFVILYDVGNGNGESRVENYFAYFSSIEKAVKAFEDCWGDRPDVNLIGVAQMVAYPCDGCGGKIYRLSTRDDGVHDVERCDTCSQHLTDDEALLLSGQEGIDWINSGPGRGDAIYLVE